MPHRAVSRSSVRFLLLRRAADRSLFLPAGAMAGLIWANIDLASYDSFTRLLHFVVNDVGMAFFFALAAKEVVEATAPGGALSSPRQAAMPAAAAVGGMIVPAAIYLGVVQLVGAGALSRGWAIPSATDIAFSVLALRLVLGPEHPAIPFLLLLAIADDALGLAILAVFYPSGPLRLLEFGMLMAIALGSAYVLRGRRVRSFWPYVLVSGGLSWMALLRGGLHPALALVPIVPFMPHAARDPGLFIDAPDSDHDTLSELEHWWKLPVQFVLFAFGLVNAGVRVDAIGAGTWAVLLAMLLGKPLGIVGFSVGARALGLRLPTSVRIGELIVVGCAAAIGFTVALFFATAAFPPGPLLDQTKAGALMTVSGAALAAAFAALLRVGRFARAPKPPSTEAP